MENKFKDYIRSFIKSEKNNMKIASSLKSLKKEIIF